MPTTYYNTVNGRIQGETTAGVATTYMTDALGSVTGTIQNGAVVNTYRYNPYGSLLAKTGPVRADPKFMWTGSTPIK